MESYLRLIIFLQKLKFEENVFEITNDINFHHRRRSLLHGHVKFHIQTSFERGITHNIA